MPLQRRLFGSDQAGGVHCYVIDLRRASRGEDFRRARICELAVLRPESPGPALAELACYNARQSSAQFDPLANLIRAGLNQPPARASTSGAWQDPSAPLPTDVCSGGCPAAGARLPSCGLSAMAVFALFRLPVRCELLVCHAIIHEQSTVQFLEVVVAQ